MTFGYLFLFASMTFSFDGILNFFNNPTQITQRKSNTQRYYQPSVIIPLKPLEGFTGAPQSESQTYYAERFQALRGRTIRPRFFYNWPHAG